MLYTSLFLPLVIFVLSWLCQDYSIIFEHIKSKIRQLPIRVKGLCIWISNKTIKLPVFLEIINIKQHSNPAALQMAKSKQRSRWRQSSHSVKISHESPQKRRTVSNRVFCCPQNYSGSLTKRQIPLATFQSLSSSSQLKYKKKNHNNVSTMKAKYLRAKTELVIPNSE